MTGAEEWEGSASASATAIAGKGRGPMAGGQAGPREPPRLGNPLPWAVLCIVGCVDAPLASTY